MHADCRFRCGGVRDGSDSAAQGSRSGIVVVIGWGGEREREGRGSGRAAGVFGAADRLDGI